MKKVISVFLTAILMFAEISLAFAQIYASDVPTFELNIISENETQAVVSVDMISGSFRALDFKLEVSSVIDECLSISVNEGVSSSSNVDNYKVSAMSYDGYSVTGEIATYTLSKKSIRSITNDDISLIITSCFSGTAIVTPIVVNNIPERAVVDIPSFALNVAYEDSNNVVLGLELLEGQIKELELSFNNNQRLHDCLDIYKGEAFIEFESKCAGNGVSVPSFVYNKANSSLSIHSAQAIDISGYIAMFVFEKDSVRITTIDEITAALSRCVSDSLNVANQVILRVNLPEPEVIGDEFILLREPEKTVYYKDMENLDMTGAELLIYGKKDAWFNVEITDDMISGFDNGTVGWNRITVTYAGISTKFDVKIVYYVSNEWQYTIDSQEVSIEGYNGTEDNVIIPEGADIYKTGNIADNAFYEHSNIRTVEIPDSVTKIGASAFSECDMLSEITVPDGVEEIGRRCFSGCSGLKKAVIPASVEKIGFDAFADVSEDFILYGYAGTAAEEYAEENGLTFVALDKNAVSMEIRTLPEKLMYYSGEIIDLSGFSADVIYDNGMTETVFDGFKCEPAVVTETGNQRLTVSYCGAEVQLEVEVSPAPLSPSFRVEGTFARPGQIINVPVLISQNPGIAAAKINISYDPDILTLTGIANGELFSDDCMTAGNNLSSLPYSVLWVNSGTENCSDDGTLIVLTFKVASDAASCKTPIIVTYDKSSTINSDLNEVNMNVVNDVIEINNRLAGDADRDGTVTLKDAALIRRWVAGWDVIINESNSDVNADNIVDLKDVVFIRRYLVGGWDVTLL